MVFLITGLQVTGLQARTLISRIGHYPLSELFVSAAIITGVVIVARFAAMANTEERPAAPGIAQRLKH